MLTGRMIAVDSIMFGRGGGRFAAHVGAGRGGEHAAPAAKDESPGETKIYQLANHGFWLTRLINTPKATCPYASAPYGPHVPGRSLMTTAPSAPSRPTERQGSFPFHPSATVDYSLCRRCPDEDDKPYSRVQSQGGAAVTRGCG